jgi:two-component sensor histidine kinase
VGIVQDITDRKNHERTLRNLVLEKETLLVELRHRIKNNLQVITNLISLEITKNTNAEVKQALGESLARIQSMALIYEQLHLSHNYAELEAGESSSPLVDLDWYLTTLTKALFQTYTSSDNRFTLEMHFEKIRLSEARAIPLGLILNELVMNCVKYAYPASQPGTSGGLKEIRIRLENTGKSAVLRVEDDGCGLPENMDSPESAGTGLKLVYTLTKQIKGVCKISSLGGTQVAIRFPL